MSFVFVIAIENNLLAKYGTISEFGSEIPITVLGIVMKISQILNSIIIGIAAGSQPILGYNYGAGKYERVKQTLKTVLLISTLISTIAFILFQTIPDKLIGIFGSGDEKYIEFACLAFRIYLMLTIFNGVQIPSGIFFQAIGKSAKSAILTSVESCSKKMRNTCVVLDDVVTAHTLLQNSNPDRPSTALKTAEFSNFSTYKPL